MIVVISACPSFGSTSCQVATTFGTYQETRRAGSHLKVFWYWDVPPFCFRPISVAPCQKFFGYKRFVLTLYQMCFFVLEFGNEYLSIVQRITYGYVESTSAYSCIVQHIHFCRTWSQANTPFAISLKAQRIADASGSFGAMYFRPSSLLLLIYPKVLYPLNALLSLPYAYRKTYSMPCGHFPLRERTDISQASSCFQEWKGLKAVLPLVVLCQVC